MKILLTRNVGIQGESHRAGETVDVSEEDARLLVGIGKAEFVLPKSKASAPQTIETREPEVTTRDPKSGGRKSHAGDSR